jgi:hypothetical protein
VRCSGRERETESSGIEGGSKRKRETERGTERQIDEKERERWEWIALLSVFRQRGVKVIVATQRAVIKRYKLLLLLHRMNSTALDVQPTFLTYRTDWGDSDREY